MCVLSCKQTHKTCQSYHLIIDRLFFIHNINQPYALNKIKTAQKAVSRLLFTQSSFTTGDLRKRKSADFSTVKLRKNATT